MATARVEPEAACFRGLAPPVGGRRRARPGRHGWQATKSTITLKGSTAIVTEFFGYAVNSILYQRGIYPRDVRAEAEVGLGMLVTTDDGLKTYLVSVLQQIND